MMEYFIDWEFLEDGQTIMPISCGIVRRDGESLYFEMKFDRQRVAAHPWLRVNVLPHLRKAEGERLSREEAAKAVLDFIGDVEKPQFWAYYADYDWVAFCQLFGPMVDLPALFPKLCMDLQQWWILLGRPSGVKPPDPEDEHDALADARWNLEFWKALCAYNDHRSSPK